jgi:hypothetical protein
MDGEDRAWAAIRDLKAEIIEHYLPWAERCVERLCSRRGIPCPEVGGAAADGLMRAVARYQPERGRFAVFAMRHVMGAALDMARRNDPRQFAHGTKPSYEIIPVSDAIEASMAAPAQEDVDVEAVRSMLARIDSRTGRELFVRCALAGETIDSAAAGLHMSVSEARAAHKEAAEAAKEAALDLGLISHAGAERAKAAAASQARARRRRFMSSSKLLEMAVESLRSGGPRARLAADSAEHVLTGTCRWCGAQVVGPRAQRGPMRVDCPDCSRKVEVG